MKVRIKDDGDDKDDIGLGDDKDDIDFEDDESVKSKFLQFNFVSISTIFYVDLSFPDSVRRK